MVHWAQVALYGFVAFSSSPRHIYRHTLPIVKPQAPPFTSDMSDTSPWNNEWREGESESSQIPEIHQNLPMTISQKHL